MFVLKGLFQNAFSQNNAVGFFSDFDPVPDPGFRFTRGNEIKPVFARVLFWGCDDFNDISCLQRAPDGDHFTVDFGSHAFIAHFRVYAVGEVHNRSAFWKSLDFSIWSENIDLIRKKIHFYRVQEFQRIIQVLLPIQELLQPFKLCFIRLIGDAPFLVFPMGRNTGFGDPVHIPGPDLDLHPFPKRSDYSGVQGLIHIGFWNGDIVLKSLLDRLPKGVDMS